MRVDSPVFEAVAPDLHSAIPAPSQFDRQGGVNHDRACRLESTDCGRLWTIQTGLGHDSSVARHALPPAYSCYIARTAVVVADLRADRLSPSSVRRPQTLTSDGSAERLADARAVFGSDDDSRARGYRPIRSRVGGCRFGVLVARSSRTWPVLRDVARRRGPGRRLDGPTRVCAHDRPTGSGGP